MTDDISNHEYLALRVRAGGHPRTRNAYFINMQTDSPISGELWQHRLYFRKDDGSWEDIFVSNSIASLPRSLGITETLLVDTFLRICSY